MTRLSSNVFLLFFLYYQYVAFFKTRVAAEDFRIRIELSDNERLIVPKHAKVNIIHPVVKSEIISPPLQQPSKLVKINKKKQPRPSTKYLKPHTAVIGKLMSSLKIETKKNLCCGEKSNESKNEKDVKVDFKDPFPIDFKPPVTVFNSVLSVNAQNHHKDPNVKPVTENIEDDLKYDFRTKTHSL